MKKLALLFLLSSLSIAGCSCNSNGEEIIIDPDLIVTVNYYVDYNDLMAKEVYHTETVKNGSKLTRPTDPTEGHFEEFPVFKGWSKKEIIDNDSDLWNFSKDKVAVEVGSTFNLFGIWVAEGE